MTTETTTPIEGSLVEPEKQVAVATKRSNAALHDATALVIDDQVTYDAAAADLNTYRAQWKQLEAKRVELKAPALETCRRIDELFRVPLQQLEQAGKTVAAEMEKFAAKERARVQEEARQARLQEEARRAELERERAEALRVQREADAARERAAQAERDRLQRIADEDAQRQREAAAAAAAAEAQAHAAAAAVAAGNEAAIAKAQADAAALAQKQADALAEQRKADEKREEEAAEARRLQKIADDQAAEAMRAANAVQSSMDMAAVTPALPVSATQAKASGVATRTTWKATSIDKRALVLGVAKAMLDDDSRADELLTYLDVNESALNAIAKQLKASARVPGVTFGEHVSVATTGRGRRS